MNHKSQPPRGNPPREQPARASRGADEAKLRAILEHKPDRIDELAQELAQQIRGLASSQLRNFYGLIVRLRADRAGGQDKSREHGRMLMMHKARVAYMSARDGRAEPLYEWFGRLFTLAAPGGIAEPAKIDAICDFAEAVVAYHKAGGKGDRE